MVISSVGFIHRLMLRLLSMFTSFSLYQGQLLENFRSECENESRTCSKI